MPVASPRAPRPLRWELAALFLLAWAGGLVAVAGGVAWGDSPELTLASARLLNAHTTGYAFWSLLVHGVGRLPVLLMSQGLSGPWLHALGGVVCAATALSLGVGRWPALLLGAAGACAEAWLASARALEVYPLAVLLLLTLGWGLGRARQGVGHWAAWVGLVWALGALHHGLGLVAGSLWVLGMGLSRSQRQRFFKALPALLWLLALATALWLYHPLRSAAAPPGGWDWCAPRTPGGLGCLLTGQGFRQFGGSLPQLVASFLLAAKGWWLGAVALLALSLAGLGLKGVARARLGVSLGLLLVGLLVSAAYMTREKEAFSAVWLAVLVLPAAQGLVALGPRRGLVGAALAAVLCAGGLGWRWRAVTEGQGGEELAYTILNSLPDDSLLLVDWDEDPQLHYLYWQEMGRGGARVMAPSVDETGRFHGGRPVALTRPVQVVYTFLLPFDWYRNQVNADARRLWGRPLIGRRFFAGELPDKGLLTRLIFRDFAPAQPVYVNKFDDRLFLQTNPGVYSYVPGPMVFRVVPSEMAKGLEGAFEINPRAFLAEPPLSRQLGRFLTYRGTVRYLNQQPHPAYGDFGSALVADPNQYAPHWYLGQMYNRECFMGRSQMAQEITQCRRRVDCAGMDKEACGLQKQVHCREGVISQCLVVGDKKMAKINRKTGYGMASDHFKAAMGRLRVRARQEPDNPLHQVFLANLYNQLGDDIRAREHEEKAKALMGGR